VWEGKAGHYSLKNGEWELGHGRRCGQRGRSASVCVQRATLRLALGRIAQFFYTFPVFALAHIRILYKNTVCSYNHLP
jgi:hypothetical protein